ncbi:MAG: hypothetical protein HOW73_50110 [Polyangiaceae bacterium]|nr:hypothetical protein [Polyangiaceae bacterium]
MPSSRSILVLAFATLSVAMACSEKKRSTSKDDEDEPSPRAAAAVIQEGEPLSCPTTGWEHVERTVTANEAGTLEIEVVDRWDPAKDVTSLMGPGSVRHLVATLGREELTAGQTVDVKWAFGSEAPSPAPPPGLCPSFARHHSDLLQAWSDPAMCTRETGNLGTAGSSSSLFLSSCGGREWRVYGVQRKSPIAMSRDRWTWIAGWVWAYPGMKVEPFRTESSWAYEVEGQRHDPTTGIYPAWTLRAKLSDRKLSKPQRVEPAK